MKAPIFNHLGHRGGILLQVNVVRLPPINLKIVVSFNNMNTIRWSVYTELVFHATTQVSQVVLHGNRAHVVMPPSPAIDTGSSKPARI